MIVTNVLIYSHSGQILFTLAFYNRRASEFMVIPGGGNEIAAALQRRGIDPTSVIFTPFGIYEDKIR